MTVSLSGQPCVGLITVVAVAAAIAVHPFLQFLEQLLFFKISSGLASRQHSKYPSVTPHNNLSLSISSRVASVAQQQKWLWTHPLSVRVEFEALHDH